MTTHKHEAAVFGRWGPRRPRLAKWGGRAVRSVVGQCFSLYGLHAFTSRIGQSQFAALVQTIRAGREAYVLGFATGNHNAGAALVRITERGTVELVCNEEEERYTAVKHYSAYPEKSIEAIRERMCSLGLSPYDLAACVSGWDYADAVNVLLVNPVLEEAPASFSMLAIGKSGGGEVGDHITINNAKALLNAPSRLGAQLGLPERMPIIGMCHHDGHAYLSYGISPFARDPGPVMTVVIDGGGDNACTSLYRCEDGEVTLLSARGKNQLDSLGRMYGLLSSTQGGWPPLSSEGRYMGAVAWGDCDRLTNRFYRRLKQLLYLGPEGHVHLNRQMANWMRYSWEKPYTAELSDILGEPIPPEDMWNPDCVLNLEDIRHPDITRDRVDKAAALQMLFEDALVHIVEHAIRTTRSHRLVLTGGTALNCVANMRLLECFDETWYQRNLGLSGTRLHLWVPPIPGDAGSPIGAAYAFAMRAGARPGAPMGHAFYCGSAPGTSAIRAAVDDEVTAASLSLGDCSDPQVMEAVADLLAHLVADGLVVGLYQGVAETGPRALGHRSILANPCRPDTRQLLNERVKHRELIRPLAPMLTRAAAARFFFLEPGACDDDYNAYNYMVLTARARPEAYEVIPAVVHHDGTGRIQIVRPDVDPLCHEFLLAMGRKTGAEVSVNTSLNVGAPIAHTPEHAIATLKRARGMDGLLMVGGDTQATLVWLGGQANLGEQLAESLRSWAEQASFELLDLSVAIRLPAVANVEPGSR